MKIRILMGTVIATGALAGLAPAVQAAPAVVATGPGGRVVQHAPPPPVYEVAPAERRGYVWSPGHYEWRNGQYAWIGGHWIAERPGWIWEEARWIERPDGSWILSGGHWVRDDDRRYSRRGPNGDRDRDGIRNRDDGDRDGDGVANWRDDYPRNPNRS